MSENSLKIAKTQPLAITTISIFPAFFKDPEIRLESIIYLIWFYALFIWWFCLIYSLFKKKNSNKKAIRIFITSYIVAFTSVFILLILYFFEQSKQLYIIFNSIGIIAILSLIIQGIIGAKLLGEDENNKISDGKFIMTLISLFYFPISIWWFYPKYMKKLEYNPESES